VTGYRSVAGTAGCVRVPRVGLRMFVQVLEPGGSGWLAAVIALLPLALLLACLAGLRISAWAAVLICAAVTVLLGVTVWDAPVGGT
jgi:hypothetical protein